jgi:hypothetical protein
VGFPSAEVRGSPSAIDVLSVSDSYHGDSAFFVLDGVYNAITPLPQSISILTGKLFAPWSARINREPFDASEDFSQILFGNVIEILLNRFLEKEAICGHLS